MKPPIITKCSCDTNPDTKDCPNSFLTADPLGKQCNDYYKKTMYLLGKPVRFLQGVRNYIVEDPSSYCEKIYGDGNPNNIDLVFIPGDGYDNLDFFRKEVLNHIDINSEHQGFFYYEPLKSYKSRFNIYIITKEPEDYSSSGYETDKTPNYVDKMLTYCPDTDFRILLQNHFPYVPYRMLPPFSRQDSFATCGTLNSTLTLNQSSNMCVHEAIGHAFGRLGDEYYYQPYLTRNSDIQKNYVNLFPNYDVAGCPKWCNGTTSVNIENYPSSCIKQITKDSCENTQTDIGLPCLWTGEGSMLSPSITYEAYGYFNDLKCLPSIDNTNIGTNCIGDSGCYFGASGSLNVWRTSSFPASGIKTIMNAGNEKFSDANIKSLENTINCCYPSDCNNFDSATCTKFSKSSSAFADCNVCKPD